MFDETELAARRYLYTLYQSLLGGEATANSLAAIDLELMGQAYDILGLEAPRGLMGAIEAARCSEDAVRATATEYTKAFIGPGKLPASPWETIHVNGDDGLFSRVTLEVRNAYRAEGFLPAEYPRVSDDHVALECAFMAALAERALEQCDQQEELTRVLRKSAEFLDRHLLKWVGAYADELAASSCAFYGAVAQELARYAAADAERLSAAA